MDQREENVSDNTKQQKSNNTTVKIVYDKSNRKCTIFRENGEVIAEEYAGRLALNFAANKATYTTANSNLEVYNIENGNKILSAQYNKDGTIERI